MVYTIRDYCHVNTNKDIDCFVGVKCENKKISVNFPIGFHFSNEDQKLRKEIILLLNIISMTTAKTQSTVSLGYKKNNDINFPIQAYIYLISQYIKRGYYKEYDVNYHVSNRGKINWSKTIKSQKPITQNKKFFYLTLVTRKKYIREQELITLIHEYCVYISFKMLGWLFTASMPKQPSLKFNKLLFKNTILDKLRQKYDDYSRRILKSMLEVIENIDESNIQKEFYYGINRFEYVWEAMIDKIYGTRDKNKFYPTASWILSDYNHKNTDLIPDSIMIYKNNIYVLDAKYYKYGITLNPDDLPKSASINKQITYGEYIEKNRKKFQEEFGDNYKVFNAFLMPCCCVDKEIKIKNIGEAISDWKSNNKSYERIQCIIIDIKYIMNIYLNLKNTNIKELAESIEQNFNTDNIH